MGNCRSDAIYETRSQKGNSARNVTLALLGLDNAGKTVTAKSLLGESLETVTPTIGFSCVNIHFGKHNITLFDLGGGKNIRGIWKNYFAEIYGMIFVIDSSDPSRLAECEKILKELLKESQIHGKPLLVLANKQDITGAMDEVDICDRIRLEDLVNTYETPCRLESCSAIVRKNKKIDNSIKIGLEWLIETIEERWNELEERVTKDIKVKQEKEQQEKAERTERVRRSKELREKKNKENDMETAEEDEFDGKNPFQPIGSLRAIQESTMKRKSKTGDNERDNGTTANSIQRLSKFQDNSLKEITSLQPSGSFRLNNADERARYSPDNKFIQRTPTRSNRLLGTEDGRQMARTKENFSDDDEEAAEMLRTRRQSNWKTKLDPPFPPTKIRNESSDSEVEDGNHTRQHPPISLINHERPSIRNVTPPVALRPLEFNYASKDGHNGLTPIRNAEKKLNKKKMARFNQTAPIPIDADDSWKEDSISGRNSFQSHYKYQTTKTPFDPDRLSGSPLMQQHNKMSENLNSKWMKTTKSYEDEEEIYHKKDKLSPRNYNQFNRVKSNYKNNSDSDDDDDITI